MQHKEINQKDWIPMLDDEPVMPKVVPKLADAVVGERFIGNGTGGGDIVDAVEASVGD